MRNILIVVDMQNDFIYGSLGTPEAREIVSNVENKIRQYMNSDEGFVVFTRDTHFPNYLETREGRYLPVKHCLHDSEGWQVIPELQSYADRAERILDKRSFGYDHWRDVFSGIEEEIESIELIGVCTDICVVSNALVLKGLFPETQMMVDASCCAGVTPEKHRAALEVMKSCQINVNGE